MAVDAARRAEADHVAEVAKHEVALAKIERDYLGGAMPVDDWQRLKAKLADELDGARAAVAQIRTHVQQLEQASPVGDAQQALLEYLAEIRRAVASGVEKAPNLNALRNVLHELFESIQLIKGDDLSPLSAYKGTGVAELTDELPAGDGVYLVPVVRSPACT